MSKSLTPLDAALTVAAASEADELTSYPERGRKHEALSNADLAQAFKLEHASWCAAGLPAETSQTFVDLRAEYSLRDLAYVSDEEDDALFAGAANMVCAAEPHLDREEAEAKVFSAYAKIAARKH